MVCYDITCGESFANVERWLEDVGKFAAPGVARLLVGTKADLAEESRAVPTESGQQLADRHRMLGFLETSAKDNHNVDSAFAALAQELKARYVSSSPSVDR